MATVTQRIKAISQPYRGYLPVKSFTVTQLTDAQELQLKENIHPSLVGMAVDYLTRFKLGSTPEKSFEISLMGASAIREDIAASYLLCELSGLDDLSITNACKLTGYDVCYRAGIDAYRPVEDINPDERTIHNIRTMVERTLSFFEKYGPVIADGFTFEGGGIPKLLMLVMVTFLPKIRFGI
jgi:hypothetical protein